MWQIEQTTIILCQGDITEFEGDAIVNAANTQLILGAGVAGAIKKKGGTSIQEECNKIGPVQLGDAAITTGGLLEVRFVIHGASMHLGGKTTEDSLRDTIRSSLQIGVSNKIQTIAFPAIGTGIAGFPLGKCAKIMLETFSVFLINRKHNYDSLTVYLHTPKDFQVFKKIFKDFFGKTRNL